MTKDLGFQHVYQPAGQADAPTLLLLHGTGADEHDLLGLGQALAPGAAMLSPRGKVSEHGMNRWFRRLAEGVYDVDDVVHRAGELAEFVSAAADTYGLDPANIVAVGFSNGANIAAATLLLHPGAVRGAVLLAAAAPLQGRTPERVDLSGTSVFLAAGTADQMIPFEQAELLATQLADLGAAVTFQRHPGGHQIPPQVLAGAQDWMTKLRAASGEAGLP